MRDRVIAIGDIHGCGRALEFLLQALQPTQRDVIVTLGDYIDRGCESRNVLDRMIRLSNECQLVPLLGNHEEMLLDALEGTGNLSRWLTNGGVETLRSYGWQPTGTKRQLASWFPKSHLEFLRNCRNGYETTTHIFVHAGLIPELPLHEQPTEALRWRVTDQATTKPHKSGKVVVVGHTPQLSGEILDLGFLVCIDTHCVRGGWLTALNVTSGQVWQFDQNGNQRLHRSFLRGSE